jgi:flagellar protein FlaJ
MVEKKMPKMDQKIKKTVWVTSVAVAVAIILFDVLVYSGSVLFDDMIFFAAIAGVTPPALISYIDYKWRRAIDEHLPDLFRSIVQAQETGMTLVQALQNAAKRNYGPLTAELKKMNTQISWGMPFEQALLNMGKRVNTVLVQRTVPMIIEASRSGGRVEKVFDPMGKFIQTTLMLDKERRTQTRPYIAIIYVAFFVFLFTIILLFRSFFTNMNGLSQLATAAIPSSEMQRIFFRMTSIQAFFGGLVAGKMGDGTVTAGLKHSLILMLAGYIALKLFM